MTPDAAVFVMPRRPEDWGGAAALWITAAGWAAAAARYFGGAWVVSPCGTVTPEVALGYTGLQRSRATGAAANPRHNAMFHARNLAKDTRQWWRARQFKPPEDPEWRGRELAFVWQHHDLFHRAGEGIARQVGAPLVSYVHAPQVWEARRWGVERPGYGDWLERAAERPQLRASDVVCCVSPEVADELVRFDVPTEKILVSPMAVDADRFRPDISGLAVRNRLGLGDHLVVGWTGSFRDFHGVDRIIDAFAEVHNMMPSARLLLVGEGPARFDVEARASALGMSDAVRFPGAISNVDIPEYVAAMDVALVSAQAGAGFHYSPLKLREYLASGRAVVAPAVGEIASVVHDGESAVLYQPDDAQDLATKLLELLSDEDRRARLGQYGRVLAVETSTWDRRLADLLAFPAFQA